MQVSTLDVSRVTPTPLSLLSTCLLPFLASVSDQRFLAAPSLRRALRLSDQSTPTDRSRCRRCITIRVASYRCIVKKNAVSRCRRLQTPSQHTITTTRTTTTYDTESTWFLAFSYFSSSELTQQKMLLLLSGVLCLQFCEVNSVMSWRRSASLLVDARSHHR